MRIQPLSFSKSAFICVNLWLNNARIPGVRPPPGSVKQALVEMRTSWTSIAGVTAALLAAAQPLIAAPAGAAAAKLVPVVRVTATDQPWDFFHPWTKHAPVSHEGLGAVLDNGEVLVTAELIEDANYVELERAESGDKVPATVVAVDYEADLALLKPADDGFLKGITPLELTDAGVGDHLAVWQLETHRGALDYRCAADDCRGGEIPGGGCRAAGLQPHDLAAIPRRELHGADCQGGQARGPVAAIRSAHAERRGDSRAGNRALPAGRRGPELMADSRGRGCCSPRRATRNCGGTRKSRR